MRHTLESDSPETAEPIAQMAPWFDSAEKNAIAEYLDAGGWLTEFKRTEQFERAIANYVGSKHCVVVANGTVSLTTALLALDVGPGDEVILPDLTMFGSFTATLLAGAKPILVDIDRRNGCIDLQLAENAITAKTKAMMVVSLNGRCPDMQATVSLCRRHNISLLEDAAQSLGSIHNAKHLGTFGDIGSFSFSAPKIITTGQGGALVTDDEDLACRMRKIKDFGRIKAGVDVHDAIGYNFKFTDLQAVVGVEQMKKLPWRVKRKKEIFDVYRSELRDVREVEFLQTDCEQTAPWFIDIFVPDPAGLKQYLANHNIGSRPIYPALHSQEAVQISGAFAVTDDLTRRGLWLPSSSFLTDEQVLRVCHVIKRFFEE